MLGANKRQLVEVSGEQLQDLHTQTRRNLPPCYKFYAPFPVYLILQRRPYTMPRWQLGLQGVANEIGQIMGLGGFETRYLGFHFVHKIWGETSLEASDHWWEAEGLAGHFDEFLMERFKSGLSLNKEQSEECEEWLGWIRRAGSKLGNNLRQEKLDVRGTRRFFNSIAGTIQEHKFIHMVGTPPNLIVRYKMPFSVKWF